MTDPTALQTIRTAAGDLGTPVRTNWMGGPYGVAGEELLNRAGTPTLPYPDTAAWMFIYMWSYDYAIKGLYDTPAAG